MAARAALLAKLEKWLNGMPDTMAAGTLGRGTLTVPVGRQHSERAAARARERPATAKPAVYVSGTYSVPYGGRGPPCSSELARIARYRGQPESQSGMLTPPREVRVQGKGTPAFWSTFGRQRRSCAAAQA